jgi:SAM-dependent methyltransferase
VNHNVHYQPLLLRLLPAHPEHVLDVGCGAGGFATALAGRARHVDALDRSPVMVAAARERVPANVTVHEDDVLTRPLPPEHYDAITSISTLHHLPLPDVLPRLAAALRPGGVLAAIALPRSDLPRELPLEVAAALTTRWVTRTLPPDDPRRDGLEHPQMPVQDPALTVRQVRAQAQASLPGAEVRRLLLWRYLLVWRKPGPTPGR